MISLEVNESYDGRLARIAVGVFTVSIGIELDGLWIFILGAIGLVPLVSGMIGWCPFCALCTSLNKFPVNRFTINLKQKPTKL
jgi:hypothetical protein